MVDNVTALDAYQEGKRGKASSTARLLSGVRRWRVATASKERLSSGRVQCQGYDALGGGTNRLERS